MMSSSGVTSSNGGSGGNGGKRGNNGDDTPCSASSIAPGNVSVVPGIGSSSAAAAAAVPSTGSIASSSVGAPAKKRARLEFDYDSRVVASSQEDLDIGLLRVQNRRLAERILQRQRAEADWKARIESMEKKQMNSDTKMYSLSRHWNLLNEDIRVMLERFDPDANAPPERSPPGATPTSSTATSKNESSRAGTGVTRRRVRKIHDSDDDDEEDDNNNNNNNNNNDVSVSRKISRRLGRRGSIDDDDEDDDDEDEDDMDVDTTGVAGEALNEESVSFIRSLMTTNCDKEEMDDEMRQRVALSARTIAKLLTAYDRMVAKYEKLSTQVRSIDSNRGGGGGGDDDDDDDGDEDDFSQSQHPRSPDSPEPSGGKARTRFWKRRAKAAHDLNDQLASDNRRLNRLVTSLHERHHRHLSELSKLRDDIELVKDENEELKNRNDSLEFELNKSRTREQRMEDHFYEAREKLRDMMSGAGGNVAANIGGGVSGDGSVTGGAGGHLPIGSKLEDMKREAEESRELANSRLQELDTLNAQHKDALKEREKLKMDLQCIPDVVIHESAEYKSLQSHFSVLFNESMQSRTLIDEMRAQLTAVKNAHLRQIECMESEELAMQKKLRNECMQLEDQLSQVKKEYEMLRIEFEQTLAANEQTGPINREMRHLITSLQNHSSQLKGENTRLKNKYKEAMAEIGRLKAICDDHGIKVALGGYLVPVDHQPKIDLAKNLAMQQQQQQQIGAFSKLVNSQSSAEESGASKDTMMIFDDDDSRSGGALIIATPAEPDELAAKSADVKKEIKSEDDSSSSAHHSHLHQTVIKREHHSNVTSPDSVHHHPHHHQQQQLLHHHPHHLDHVAGGSADSESSSAAAAATASDHHHRMSTIAEYEIVLRDLRAQLKKAHESNKELKLLLDMFKSVDKEKRDKATILASEKRYRAECEAKDRKIRLMEEHQRTAKSKFECEEYAKKITKYEELIAQLQKTITNKTSEEEALLNEMEVTGQAFEDMQEQNIRLIQQLREKDDANFKLISERIKTNQITKLLKDEKELLTEQILMMQNQLEATNQVVRKLEEKERILQSHVSTYEKELNVRQQAMEFNKRKTVELAQQSADLKLHLDKYKSQIRDAQELVADKTTAFQQEAFKSKRLVEEVAKYKSKYERAKKFEIATTADEVLQEEIRELHEELTCPSCKVKRKDAVLNKCFHVFCYDCLKTRYETRQRKCPKCNQSFSANDFHRLYLA